MCLFLAFSLALVSRRCAFFCAWLLCRLHLCDIWFCLSFALFNFVFVFYSVFHFLRSQQPIQNGRKGSNIKQQQCNALLGKIDSRLFIHGVHNEKYIVFFFCLFLLLSFLFVFSMFSHVIHVSSTWASRFSAWKRVHQRANLIPFDNQIFVAIHLICSENPFVRYASKFNILVQLSRVYLGFCQGEKKNRISKEQRRKKWTERKNANTKVMQTNKLEATTATKTTITTTTEKRKKTE